MKVFLGSFCFVVGAGMALSDYGWSYSQIAGIALFSCILIFADG